MDLVAGPHHPVKATPSVGPTTARRTTTIDTSWPDLERGRTSVEVRGLDVIGDRVLDEVDVRLDVDIATGEVAGHDGASLRAGWGRYLAHTFADEGERRTLRYSALDDVNGAFLVSGYAMLREGVYQLDPEMKAVMAERQADICIGWATGSQMLVSIVEKGVNPVPTGPAAPVLSSTTAALEGHRDMRRHRRLDVARRDDGGLDVQSHFRDSYQADDHEMVLHEWLVDAVVDVDGRIASVAADPRTLPWSECPGAAASASAVVGTSLDEIVPKSRTDLVGNTTCTHLTSTLRALADVAALARHLP